MSSRDFIDFRPIRRSDNLQVKKIILNSLEEYDANREGFAAKDPEIEFLSEFYDRIGGHYFVAAVNNELVGGAGIAPLKGADNIWELQKMYIDSKARGKGIGKQLLKQCIDKAKELKIESLYIETLNSMKQANHLYQLFGFELIESPLGDSGHFGCDRYYLLKFHE